MAEEGYDSFDDEIIITTPSVIDFHNSSEDSFPPTPPPVDGSQASPDRAAPMDDDDDCSDPPPTPPPASTRKRKPIVESDDDEVNDQNLPPTPPPAEYELPKSMHLGSAIRSRDGTFLSDSPSQKALQLLKHYFGHSSFRPKQWDIVRNALEGKDQLVLMSTGYGKSVCYQLPGLMSSSLTLVISPLISLMNDQVMGL
ncbi:hypothetical protein OSTOST_02479, partial [Ostertagia ostertagi]